MLREKLTLASQSPRRAEILKTVGWDCVAIPANIDETRLNGENAVSYVKRLAQTKAQTVAAKGSAGLILGADTVVVSGADILGQPRDDDDGRRMLRLLSGKWHEVVTGVAIVNLDQPGGPLVAHETTRVRFAEMSAAEIDWYVSTGEPRGKAGAYAIQGKGALFIKEIQGDYFNVVGLPIRLVFQMLTR